MKKKYYKHAVPTQPVKDESKIAVAERTLSLDPARFAIIFFVQGLKISTKIKSRD